MGRFGRGFAGAARRCLLALVICAVGGLGRAALSCEAAPDSSRIAVAGGSLTEILYFLGAEARIVGVDTTSNYPPQASEFPSVGYVRALSAEGLLSLNPTLVLGEDDMGPPETLTAVRRAGVPAARVPETHSAAGIVAKVRCVASVLGMDAAALVEEQLAPLVARLANLHEQTSPASTRKVAFLLALRDGAPVGAGRNTSADGLLAMVGAHNVFADFEGWKPVSVEAMAQAAPDYIVATQRGADMAGGAAPLAAHPALRTTPAGQAPERLIVMDGMELLGFGPRTLQAALRLAERLRAQD